MRPLADRRGTAWSRDPRTASRRRRTTRRPRSRALGLTLAVAAVTISCGDGPVDVTETEIWSIELEQLEDGSEAIYPHRGTIHLRLRLNRTTQPDPLCDGEDLETVTAFLADVEALPSRMQGAGGGSADGSWNCHGMVATVRLNDGTTYELGSDRPPGGISGEWFGFRESERWTSGARRGRFDFLRRDFDQRVDQAGNFDGRLRQSHFDVLAQNRTDRDWRLVLAHPNDIRAPVSITYFVFGSNNPFEIVPAGATVSMSWPSHENRRRTQSFQGLRPYRVFVTPPGAPVFGVWCYLTPDHPDQAQLILVDDDRVECGDGWVSGFYLAAARSPLFVEGQAEAVQDTVTLFAVGVARDLVVEGTHPAVTGSATPLEDLQSVLTVTVAPDAPRTEHGLRIIGRAFEPEGVTDTLFLPVNVYELDVAPASDSLFIPPGASDTTSLLLDSEGVFDDIRFSTADLPQGVLQSVPSFDPTVTNVKTGVGSVITVPVADDAPPGVYTMTVCATIVADPQERCHPGPLTLVVPEGANLAAARSPLFVEAQVEAVQDTVTLFAAGIGPDLVVEGTHAAVTGSATSIEDGQSVLTVTVAPDAPRTEHGLRIIGQATELPGVADTVFLPVNVYELDLAPASDTLSIEPGASDTTSLFLDTEGVDDDIRFSATDVPPEVLQSDPSFDPTVTSVKIGVGSVITVPVAADAPTPIFTMTVCATIVADPQERCHPAPLTVVLGAADACQAFDLRLDFDPVEGVAGASDQVPVFVDRTAGFDGPVELALDAVAGGPSVGDALGSWAFAPNPVGADDTFSILLFGMRDDVAAGTEYEFRVLGGSPQLSGAEESCTTPITFEVISP